MEINLSALEYNIKSIKNKIGPSKEIFAVIKADGYGHGAVEMHRVLKEHGVKMFGLATFQEVIELRESGATEELVMLGLTPDDYADLIVRYDVTAVTCSYPNALAMAREAEKSGKTACGLVAVDTGMGRIGLLPDDPDSVAEVERISKIPGFKMRGLITHFATADWADQSYAKKQEYSYAEFCKKLKARGVTIDFHTFANSSAIMHLPSSYYHAVRPGITLCGCYPSDEIDRKELSIKPIMSVKANIVHLKKISAGTSIGYGRRFIAERESLIATVNLGYADGYPRAYSPNGKVIVGGVFAPIAGSICMDQFMIDVTDVPGVKQGDEVTIIGTDGENTISADDIAKATGTINYEILCSFGQRLPRVYINE